MRRLLWRRETAGALIGLFSAASFNSFLLSLCFSVAACTGALLRARPARLMRSFRTITTFPVAGRGIGHVVLYPEERLESEVIAELVGSAVLLDGEQQTIVGVESWLVPGRLIRAGAAITLLVARPSVQPAATTTA